MDAGRAMSRPGQRRRPRDGQGRGAGRRVHTGDDQPSGRGDGVPTGPSEPRLSSLRRGGLRGGRMPDGLYRFFSVYDQRVEGGSLLRRSREHRGGDTVKRGILALFALGLLAGCQGDHSRSEPAPPLSVPVRPGAGSDTGPSMQVSVSDVQTDPSVDAAAIKRRFADAETALLTCIDGPSTGVLALTFPIERDGAVGD